MTVGGGGRALRGSCSGGGGVEFTDEEKIRRWGLKEDSRKKEK